MTHIQQAAAEGLDLERGTANYQRILKGDVINVPLTPQLSPPVITNGTFASEDAAEQALNGGIASISIADGAIAVNPAAAPDRIAGTMVEVAGIALHPSVTTAAPAAPPARRKPVKGKCMCGKYYSAHHLADGRAFCTKDATHVGGGTFTLAPNAPAPAPVEAPQATAGGITGLEASKFESAVEMLVQAELRAVQYVAERDRLREIVKGFFDSLTVRP